MRSQNRTAITLPIPSDVPPRVVLDYIQTFEPTLRHNPGMVAYSEIPFDPGQIGPDPFFEFGCEENPIRCFQIQEVFWLGPGLTKEMKSPFFFQRSPSGMRCRCNAYAGVISWTEWQVLPLHDVSPTGSGSTSSKPHPLKSNVEQWGLYGVVIIEANRLMLPFCVLNTERYLNTIGQALIKEVCGIYLTGTI
ncbi:hypothetical protein BGZ61DRAFT_456255 [Ilyonectria robusta]|uniref:uncharacterized protein n=1 Tax=Ilyonectria robusta TaxID=1079257 RepID=UPI001E8CEEF4|nr:uncharacterized protein BGZ61DRAFT_456255 [Ilyonectria robusta]KAH8683764.1 hypothetical protein BGZ61DRAFT_456255 [Ilyonectria robusta]